MRRAAVPTVLVALALSASTAPVTAAEVIYPVASRIGLVPPAGMTASNGFVGFEDRANNVFVRLVTLPADAFATIDKTMTNDALRKQGMAVARRETVALPGGKGLLVVARQEAAAIKLQKWLLIAPIDDLTALVSFELPVASAKNYPPAVVRKALLSVTARPTVPDAEQLTLVPFKVTVTAGLRLVRVVPGVAVQFTDGPKDSLEDVDQPHLVIAVSPGGPRTAEERSQFARHSFTGLPPLKDLRLSSAEPMRIGGQPGYEIRAEAKDPKTGEEVEIVQWLRFGSGAYLRLLGLAPRKDWVQTFTRFRAVRDGLSPR
jgi:hypothetical protein